MSNKLEEILTNPDSTENFKDKFLGLILDFLEENNYDLNNLDQECEELICKIYDKNMLSSVSGGVNNKLNLAKKAGALGLSALCAVSPALGMGNQSDLKDQSELVQKKEDIAKTKNQTKKKSWLNKVDKSALLNIFGWSGFAFAGAGGLYEKVKSKNQRDELENKYSEETQQLKQDLEEANKKIQTLTDLPTLADSFVEDVKALTATVRKLPTKMTDKVIFICCYFFLYGLNVMTHNASPQEVCSALTERQKSLLKKEKEFTVDKVLHGLETFEKYGLDARYMHTASLLFLVFGDAFTGNPNAFTDIWNTVEKGKCGVAILSRDSSQKKEVTICSKGKKLANPDEEIYEGFCRLAKNKKLGFEKGNWMLGFFNTDVAN